MKKIVLLNDSLIGGGAERITLNLARGFLKKGCEVHIVLVKNIIEHEVDQNIKIHTLTDDGVIYKNKFLNKLALAKKLKSTIQNIEKDGRKVDMYISNAEDMDLLGKKLKLPNFYIRYRNSMYEYYVSKFKNKKGLKKLYHKFRFKRKFKKVYDNANIITVAKALEDDLINKMGIKPKFIKTIYNPFDFEYIREKAEEDNPVIPKVPYIIYAAKFENRKNQKLLVKAYKKTNVDIPLVLIGNTYTKSDKEYLNGLKKLIKELSLEDKIIFPGFQKNPYPWIKNAKLFVMSSNSEGLPLVLVESLILDTPVVSTDCPTGPSEVLIGDLKEFLSPVGDEDKLAQNIQKALNSYPQINDKILERFKLDYSINRYLELIN
jgi:glycosyltransferase involved in cell wall biosynthesis